mgnify:CR=1 FL=1
MLVRTFPILDLSGNQHDLEKFLPQPIARFVFLIRMPLDWDITNFADAGCMTFHPKPRLWFPTLEVRVPEL